jgi:hypothetical protein
MTATIERPTVNELDQLETLVVREPLERGTLIASLRRIENGLRHRGRVLERSGGLLDEEDKAARMSLAREDDRLRFDLDKLADDVAWFREEVEVGSEDSELRLRANAILAGLRSHRDAEASLILESADTEVGVGD